MTYLILSLLLNSPALAQDHEEEPPQTQDQLEQVHELPTISHGQIADGRQDLPKGFIGVYETEFGYAVKVGDTVAVNAPTGSSSSITALTGAGYGDRAGVAVTRGTAVNASYFSFIYNGTYAATVGKMLIAGLAGAANPTVYQAPGKLSGAEIQVLRMKLGGTKKRPVIWMECELVNAKDKANYSGVITISDYDQAIRAGEIYNPNFISREIAIARLKDAKEMLDIGAFTQEQFEEEKARYAPYLK